MKIERKMMNLLMKNFIFNKKITFQKKRIFLRKEQKLILIRKVYLKTLWINKVKYKNKKLLLKK